MPDMEAPIEDAIEQEQTLGEAEIGDEVADPEAPEADAVEQHTPVGRPTYPVRRAAADEADEGDAAEQAVVVEADDDDYR